MIFLKMIYQCWLKQLNKLNGQLIIHLPIPEFRMDLTEIGAEINVVKSAIKGIIIDELHLRGVQTLNDESV